MKNILVLAFIAIGFQLQAQIEFEKGYYIDDSGKVLQIKEMAPRDETSVSSDFFVRYALEVDLGWYEKAGLKEGDSIPGFASKVAPYLKMAN